MLISGIARSNGGLARRMGHRACAGVRAREARLAIGLSHAFGIVAVCGSALHAQLRKPVVRDSSGVRIVEYVSISGELPRLRVADKPFLDLGGLKANPSDEFDPGHPMLEATRLSDGRIVVNDMARLMFFTRSGEFLRAVGRKGRGPGEFTQLGRICRLQGDTLLAIDWSERRLSLWDSSGKLIRAFARPGEVSLDSCFPDGTVVIPDYSGRQRASDSGPSPTQRYDGRVEYLRIRPDGTVIQSLGRHARSEFVGGQSYIVTMIAGSDRYYVADRHRYELKVFDVVSGLRLVLRVTEALPTVQARLISPQKSPPRAGRATEAQRAPGSPITRPAFGSVRVDPAGRIWVQSYSAQQEWTVFDSSGVLIGRIRLEARTAKGRVSALSGVERDYIVLRERDEDDAVHLAFYRTSVSP